MTDLRELALAAKTAEDTYRATGAPEDGEQAVRARYAMFDALTYDELFALYAERDEAIRRGENQFAVWVKCDVERRGSVARAEAAEASLASYKEEVERLRSEIEARRDGSTADTIIANWFDLGRELGVPAGASVWDAVMKMRETLRTVDGHYDMLGYAKDSIARMTVREALTKEPPHAE